MILALAVLDLPFNAEAPDFKYEKNQRSVVFASETPALLFAKQIKESETRPSQVSISVHYFDPSDQFHEVDGERVDKFVTQFRPQRVCMF